ncbi:MAG: YaiI/YqxD family protein [Gammaproteobacteria bacterium]|nr:YaiI/YqxD family protein [Gammaproteobacteria bacterium]
MKIWVDADACPVAIKEILFKAARRTGIRTTLVANHYMRVPACPNLFFKRVEDGFDVADKLITESTEPGDLVVTGDIPLAADVIEKGALALSPRGELFTPENIRQRLNMRDFLDTMRSSGIESGGPPALNNNDKKAFADNLDRLISHAGK